MPVDIKSWGERLIKQGALRARQEVAALLLRERFGSVPADLEEQLADLDGATLDTLLVRLIHVASVEAFMAGVREARGHLDGVHGHGSQHDAGQRAREWAETAGATMLLVEAIDRGTMWGKQLLEARARLETRLALIHQVEARFGAVPEDLQARLAYRDQATIDALTEHLCNAATLDAFMAGVPVKVLSQKDGGMTMGELEDRLTDDTIAFCWGEPTVEEAVARYRRARATEGA